MDDKNFTAYEYKTISVNAEQQPQITDLYEAFGWEVTSAEATALGKVNISLKRDRKIRHRQELLKVERQAGGVYDEICGLKRSEKSAARAVSLTLGTAAALILGGGMSLVMLVSGNTLALVGGILLGVLGIALCVANYFIYLKLAEKKTLKVRPVIEEKEEQLANLLEKGDGLLSAAQI